MMMYDAGTWAVKKAKVDLAEMSQDGCVGSTVQGGGEP